MAYHPTLGLIDPFDGQSDLVHHVLRCVGNPDERFAEDALRILRCFRFASVLGFAIDEKLDGVLRNTPVMGTTLNVVVVAAALILYGIAFLLVEKKNSTGNFKIQEVGQIDYKTAVMIGLFYVVIRCYNKNVKTEDCQK
jgi:tRNA nucleotidyltransferase/poly(A) polymerase